MGTIGVFCGARAGNNPEYLDDAHALGAALAMWGHDLVYGGAGIGLMGAVADACLAAGGKVCGVVPQAILDLDIGEEIAHSRLTEQHVVANLHLRKEGMENRADAFVVLPGGLGTAEELTEVLSWAQLGIHTKPILLLNTAGYFDALLAWLEHVIQSGFAAPGDRKLLRVCTSVEELGRELHLYFQ